MTAQEEQMLQSLFDRINRSGSQEKDSDAEQFIQQTLGTNPDSLYVMAQTILVQEYALNQAQKQIADLRLEVEQAQRPAIETKHSGNFLGNLLGRHDKSQPGAPPPPPPAYSLESRNAGQGVGPGLVYPSGGYPIPNAPPQQGGGFLRSAMRTATGVAAGALAFEGIESLMHGFGQSTGYGTDLAPSGLGGGPREEIVNTYYGGSTTGASHRDASSFADRQGEWTDRHDDLHNFDDASGVSGDGRFQDACVVSDDPNRATNPITDPDGLSGTSDTDYSSQGDDSMLSDDMGDQGSDSNTDSGDSNGF